LLTFDKEEGSLQGRAQSPTLASEFQAELDNATDGLSNPNFTSSILHSSHDNMRPGKAVILIRLASSNHSN